MTTSSSTYKTFDATPLASTQSNETIVLLPNSYLMLCWGVFRLEMRSSDLLVLANTLTCWRVEQGANPRQSVSLWISDHAFHLLPVEFGRFCQLVDAACAQLARKTVRWADCDIWLETCDGVNSNGNSRFSCN